jgi:DNA repair exonuclease SbcCD ATPase subunit
MSGTRHPVQLQETDSEFLLFIHAAQKERAKAIDGRLWDTERRCWVYPKTARVYDAIIAEFGDDMIECTVRRPSLQSASAQTASLQEENASLRSELGKIHKTLELISAGTANGNRTELQALEAALAARQNELSEVRVRLQERERELEQLRKSVTAAEAEVERLRGANVALQMEVSKSQGVPDPAASFERLVKDAAKEATGRHAQFCALIDRLRVNDLLPNEFVKQLERELRRILSTDDRNLSLHDLITMARDSELLTEKGIDLAHTIRRHRNILTHENTDVRTHSECPSPALSVRSGSAMAGVLGVGDKS